MQSNISEYELFFEIFTPIGILCKSNCLLLEIDSNGKTSRDEWTRTTGKRSSEKS